MKHVIVPKKTNVHDFAIGYMNGKVMEGFSITCTAFSSAHNYACRTGIPFDLVGEGEISGACGQNVEWILESNGLLTIEGIGKMEYEANSTTWYPYMDIIKEVYINKGVQNINWGAFLNAGSLEQVYVGYNVKEISAFAFGYCSNLNDIYFLGDVIEINPNAFTEVVSNVFYFDTWNWEKEDMLGYGGNLTWISEEHFHDYNRNTTSTTCMEGAYNLCICKICGHEYKEEIGEPAGHSYGEWVTESEATCTKAGSKHRSCMNKGCDSVETEEIPATGHTEVVDEAVEATCTEAGKTEGSHCSVCKEVLVEQKEVAAIGHSYGEWVTESEATCTKAGSRIYGR